jgi:hypothetical protein
VAEEGVAEVRNDCSHAAVRARVTCHLARTRKPTTTTTGTAGDHGGSHPRTAAAVTAAVASRRTTRTQRRRAAATRAARRVTTGEGEDVALSRAAPRSTLGPAIGLAFETLALETLVFETLAAVEPLKEAGLRTGTAAEPLAGGAGVAPALLAASVRPSTRMAVENRSTERLRTASSWRRRVSGTR